MYTVYILKNLTGRYYIGQTDNLEQRLNRHNSGKVFSTKNRDPWEVVYTIQKPSRSAAMVQERWIKDRGAKRFLVEVSQAIEPVQKS